MDSVAFNNNNNNNNNELFVPFMSVLVRFFFQSQFFIKFNSCPSLLVV